MGTGERNAWRNTWSRAGRGSSDRIWSCGWCRRARACACWTTSRRESARIFSRWRSHVEVIEGDVRRPADCQRACEGMEVVFHEAAMPSVPRSVEDPATTHAANVDGTFNLLLAARDRKCRRVVYAASSSAYGDVPELPKRETMLPAPLSPYAAAQARRRVLLPGVLDMLRSGDGFAALFQRFRPAAGPPESIRGGDPGVRDGHSARRGPHRLR